jgi:hypothetical protein
VANLLAFNIFQAQWNLTFKVLFTFIAAARKNNINSMKNNVPWQVTCHIDLVRNILILENSLSSSQKHSNGSYFESIEHRHHFQTLFLYQ